MTNSHIAADTDQNAFPSMLQRQLQSLALLLTPWIDTGRNFSLRMFVASRDFALGGFPPKLYKFETEISIGI
jgi:hypothetical protein